MKKVLLSSVALLGLTAGALAADLPSRRAPVVPYVAVPVFTWTGFYVGLNAGYGFSDNNDKTFSGYSVIGPAVTTPATGFVGPGAGNRSGDGFVGGGQVGYNYQIGSIVLGVEGDVQYTDFNRGRGNNGVTYGSAVSNLNIFPTVAGAPGNVAFFNNGGRGSDILGTVRGRVGYTFDRVLLYATGGLALRDSDNDNKNLTFATPFFVPGAGTAIARNGKPNDTGYAVGGGIEYAFTPNITGKIEGLYVDFGSSGRNNVVGATNTGAPIVGSGRGGSNDDFALVRAGINYKFTMF